MYRRSATTLPSLALLLVLTLSACSSWQRVELGPGPQADGRLRVRAAGGGWLEVRGAVVEGDSVFTGRLHPTGERVRLPLADLAGVQARRHNVPGTLTLILAAPVVWIIVFVAATWGDTYTLGPGA